MGDPTPGGQDDDSTCPDNYIIIDDTDSDPSEDDFIDEAGADIMESSTTSKFLVDHHISSSFPPFNSIVQALCNAS